MKNMKTEKIKLAPLPENWDEKPKGCWVPHPESREICQRPDDGHTLHMLKHPNGLKLECWRAKGHWAKFEHLEDVDFRNYDAIEMINEIKAFRRPNLEPLVKLLAKGYAFDKSNQKARIAIADGEREVEELIKKD